MLLDLTDTIAAIASAPGGGVRGILRLSGPSVVACLQRFFRIATGERADLANIRRPTRLSGFVQLGRVLGEVPCDLYLWPTSRSYTRQPSAELHLPGSPPILQAALTKVGCYAVRVAQPGEFTLRAFMAGRLDLTQAEAVLGVIDADSQRELDAALTQLAGGLSGPLGTLRGQLLDLLAHLEAGLDFVEEDIEFITAQELDQQLARIEAAIVQIRDQMVERDTSADAFHVVLAGRPNAGKSSLLNALAGEDAAIVSPVAGTTRDYVTREVCIDGLRCLLTDTAGLAGAVYTPDATAEELTLRLMGKAQLVLRCVDVGQAIEEFPPAIPAGELLVLTKCDTLSSPAMHTQNAIPTSVYTGFGLNDLRNAISRRLAEHSDEAGRILSNTSARCRESLLAASQAITLARITAGSRGGDEFVAAEMRIALDELGRVTGAVYTDDVLDRIFSRFCIGK